MNFPSIEIQGSILSNDLLAKIRNEQANFQLGKDFKPEYNNSKLKDEISLVWQEAKGQWIIYKSKLSRLKDNETGTTETRNFWISPLLTNLGYNPVFSRQSEELNGKSFPINHRDANLDNFPIYIGGYNESLDKRSENKSFRISPHALLQEYLNYSEHLYGIVTNGRFFRLLRDASRITRLSYIEFNLEKMMEEDLYSDFVIFYRIMHSSRMPQKIDAGAESIIEKYHQEGLEAGSTIRNKLGDAVKGAILKLANGFINHPNNSEIREAVETGNLDVDEYYRHQLRIIYRLLFILVIEERNLIYADSKTPETKRFSNIYFQYYSLQRLRKVAGKFFPPDSNNYYDLWLGLVSSFSLFEQKEIGEKLGIMALQGNLFDYDAIAGNSYDLYKSFLNNEDLLTVIKSLCYFENDKKVLIAVNYGGLDVEEFGSVYEGLLELKIKISKVPGSDDYRCNYDASNERSKSGSHYTPEELVQPLIKHSLEYLIEDRIKPYFEKKTDKNNTVQSLLNLKVCDVACGSGHILLSAARRISLAVARIQTDEEQPNPLSIRKAMKDVVRSCIYGVDKNPLAVELCKIALWLEAFNPGEPLNFLDHRIKCGDAIVGLAHREELEKGIPNEAYKTLPGEDKDIAKAFRDRNIKERKVKGQTTIEYESKIKNDLNSVIEKYNAFKNLPETNPDEIRAKEKQYHRFEQSAGRLRLQQLADAQVAPFFIPKTTENKNCLLTDAEYLKMLSETGSGLGAFQSQKMAKATAVAHEHRIFHWFIEFPEVFIDGGFDCILGNPPFLGGQKLTGTFGNEYLEYLKFEYAPIGSCDLVTYFFRRIFSIIKEKGFQSLISTNTIAQGGAREGGLDVIQSMGGSINFAIRSMKWPGLAAVEVSLLTIHKGNWRKEFFLDNKKVKFISTYLDDSQTIGNPYTIKQNEGKSFQGSIVLGMGFILEPWQAENLINKNPRNKDVLFPYLNGDDLNSSPNQEPSRWVINFFDWEEEYCRNNYPDCFEIIENLVKPERQRWEKDENGNDINGTYALRKPLPEKWWIYGEKRPGLYRTISGMDMVMLVALTSKTVAIDILPSRYVYAHATGVFALKSYKAFLILQSNFHFQWAWKYASSMKSDLRYTPSDIFETYPFPQNLSLQQEQRLEAIGELYHEHRRKLMLEIQFGLTKTYNIFHDKNLPNEMSGNEWRTVFPEKVIEILNIINKKHCPKSHFLLKIEHLLGILKLRELHVQMDKSVLDAYGWTDIELRHDFYEVDYLPENDRIRFTIHPDSRKEILKRLLDLNHKIHEEEVAAGLWDKKKSVKKKPVEKDEDEIEMF